jgi:hypothetical protein
MLVWNAAAETDDYGVANSDWQLDPLSVEFHASKGTGRATELASGRTIHRLAKQCPRADRIGPQTERQRDPNCGPSVIA